MESLAAEEAKIPDLAVFSTGVCGIRLTGESSVFQNISSHAVTQAEPDTRYIVVSLSGWTILDAEIVYAERSARESVLMLHPSPI